MCRAVKLQVEAHMSWGSSNQAAMESSSPKPLPCESRSHVVASQTLSLDSFHVVIESRGRRKHECGEGDDKEA